MSHRLVISTTSTHHNPDPAILRDLTDGVHAGLRDLAHNWGQTVWQIVDAVTATGFRIVLIDNPDVADALGYHDVDPKGVPYARVFLDPIFAHGGTWLDGGMSVSAVVAHEAFELVGDPAANLWASDGTGMNWARELCDACENDWYDVNTPTVGRKVSVSDFLYPSYFNPWAPPPYDRCHKIAAPFDLAPGGYAIRQTPGKTSNVFGFETVYDTTYPEWRKALKGQGSRTQARHNWLAQA